MRGDSVARNEIECVCISYKTEPLFMFEFVIPACLVPALQHDGAGPAQFRACGRQVKTEIKGKAVWTLALSGMTNGYRRIRIVIT